MKCFLKRILLATALLTIVATMSYAQEPSEVETIVKALVKKYENTDGITCMEVVKGSGLELVKMMLKKELGKSFMKGVTGITVIDYSNASEQICQELHKDLDQFLSLLKEFKVNDQKELPENEFMRCFAASDTGTLSDFVIAFENGPTKSVMYMAGKIVMENLDN